METTDLPLNVTEGDVSPFSFAGCVVIVAVFSLISTLTMVGNGLVVWLVLTTKRMRTVTNYFLVNLSLGDMLSVFQIIPNVYYAINNDWVFELAYCKFSQFFTAFGISLSVLTFTGLTADRYIAIKYPLRPRSRPATILCIIGCIWVVSFLIGLPGLVAAKISLVLPQEFENGSDNSNTSFTIVSLESTNATDDLRVRRACTYDWAPEWGIAYDVALFILMYILPLTILFATYIPITVKLWSDRGLGEVTRAQIEGIKSKRRVVKMLIAVMVIFAICWLPYQLFFLTLHAPIDHEHPSLPVIFICCYGLAMSNSMYNPIVYCIMNRRFRDGFLNAISCCPFVKHYRRKCQRTRFHRNFQTLIVSSDVEHAPLPGQLSQKYNRKVPQKHQTTNSAMA
ncbi:Tachykinin-like peptides receptor 99D [Echinococcus granulosus]|uniref:Tachykinin-like peptides receptor 99D n=1 Tax=Echinococcus granulosus TaxID=6210 RepID=W6V1F1_ECHGR|nr:Tachykinin-like peptides receptor 99D [Echinococcus granulosus]EUB59694.1 Tachykinin-like peptides receptor 99D [Echinococcus granulosus]